MTRQWTATWLLVATTWVVGGVACGGSKAPGETAAARLLVAQQPDDPEARLALADTAYQDGRLGEALRELLWLADVDALPDGRRSRLGSLLVLRGAQRLVTADPGALADFSRAGRLGGAVTPEQLAQARALCAVAALRHSSEFRRARAATCLAQLDPASVYRRYDAPESLSIDALEKLWDWFAAAGAKKQALQVAQAYVDRGGRDAGRLGEWKKLHRWWHGDRRPLLPVGAARDAGPEMSAWQRLEVAAAQMRAEPDTTAAQLAADWEVSEWSGPLANIIEGYQRDPALADRLAARFVDGHVYGARESAILCELFFRLGDGERARIWAQHLVDIAPKLPASHAAAGLAHAVVGDVPRADEFFVAAAAASGDPGRDWALASHTYRRVGQPLAAVAAGRRALSLTARGWDMHILLEISLAQHELGRESQAEQTLEALWSRIALADRAAARSLAAEMRNAKGTGRLHTLLGPIRESFGF